jgi:YhcH/YjgK/YiaL family protein
MALVGTLSTLRAQAARPETFSAAFGYLDDVFRPGSAAAKRLAAAAVGTTERIELAGGSFALEQVYHAKARPEGFFESHRRYVDVQVVVTGEEMLELADIGRLTVKKPYDPERDLVVYEDFATASLLRLVSGEAAIFFPVDGHMPCLRPGTAANLVRKTVIKVPVPA